MLYNLLSKSINYEICKREDDKFEPPYFMQQSIWNRKSSQLFLIHENHTKSPSSAIISMRGLLTLGCARGACVMPNWLRDECLCMLGDRWRCCVGRLCIELDDVWRVNPSMGDTMGLVGGVKIGGSHMEAVENSLYHPKVIVVRLRSERRIWTTPINTLRSIRP